MKHLLASILVFLTFVGIAMATGPKDPMTLVGGYPANVTLISLPDQTICAVLIGPSQGGISCNWRQQK